MNHAIQMPPQKRAITLGEAIAVLIVILGACLIFWSSTLTRLTVLEDKNIQDGIDKTELKTTISKMDGKLDDNNTQTTKRFDDLKENINELKILLERKKDR